MRSSCAAGAGAEPRVCMQQEQELHFPKGYSPDAPRGNTGFQNTTLLQPTALLLAKKEEGRKSPDICIKISSFYYIPHNTSSKSSNFHKIFFTHRQLGDAGDVRAQGAGENRE